jgi:hypothetical protein
VPRAGTIGRSGGPGTIDLSCRAIDRASGRARALLFRVVPRAVNRARPIWNIILSAKEESCERVCSLVVTRAPVAPQVLGSTPRGIEFLRI